MTLVIVAVLLAAAGFIYATSNFEQLDERDPRLVWWIWSASAGLASAAMLVATGILLQKASYWAVLVLLAGMFSTVVGLFCWSRALQTAPETKEVAR